MPEPIKKSENELTWQQLLELWTRTGSDEMAEIRNQEQPARVANTPARELVLRVIDSLKRA